MRPPPLGLACQFGVSPTLPPRSRSLAIAVPLVEPDAGPLTPKTEYVSIGPDCPTGKAPRNCAPTPLPGRTSRTIGSSGILLSQPAALSEYVPKGNTISPATTVT